MQLFLRKLEWCSKGLRKSFLLSVPCFLWLVFLCAGFSSFFVGCLYADNPASFQLDYGTFARANKTLKIFGTLKIASSWHVYAVDSVSQKAPYFEFDKDTVFSVNQKNLQISWPKSLLESKLEPHYFLYKDSVPIVFEQRNVSANTTVFFKGALYAAACSDRECRLLQLPFAYHIDVGHENVVITADNSAPHKQLSFWILLIAFLGGFTLNFMPCVLPVLGVKLLVFTKKACPRGFFPVVDLWMVVLGIFSAFMILAFGAVVVKAFGASVGWGLHFQNRYFLSGMLVVVSLFTANLWELFDITLPHMLQTATSRVVAHTRSFLTGIFSVLLATPCTAPLVGTAVGFALSQRAVDIFLVFTFLALGFSAPYWITALLPSHHLRLPQPGPWLLWLRRLLSVLLLGTLSWLAHLLSLPHGYFSLFLVLLVICLGWGLLLFRKIFHGIFKKLLFRICFTLWLCGAITLPLWQEALLSQNAAIKVGKSASARGIFENFAPERIASYLKAGKTVFIDITASWCLLCQFNKRAVLDKPWIQKMLKAPNIVCMQADWTRDKKEQSAAILSFLKRFGKAGIPFNVVFGPQAPSGIVLPEVLTQGALEDALQRASDGRFVTQKKVSG